METNTKQTPGYTETKRYSSKVYRLCSFEDIWNSKATATRIVVTRDNKLRKAVKHEVTNVLEEKLEAPLINYVPVCDVKIAIFFDFMLYARNLGTDKLKMFGDFVPVLWKQSVFCQKTHNVDTFFLFIFGKLNKI